MKVLVSLILILGLCSANIGIKSLLQDLLSTNDDFFPESFYFQLYDVHTQYDWILRFDNKLNIFSITERHRNNYYKTSAIDFDNNETYEAIHEEKKCEKSPNDEPISKKLVDYMNYEWENEATLFEEWEKDGHKYKIYYYYGNKFDLKLRIHLKDGELDVIHTLQANRPTEYFVLKPITKEDFTKEDHIPEFCR